MALAMPCPAVRLPLSRWRRAPALRRQSSAFGLLPAALAVRLCRRLAAEALPRSFAPAVAEDFWEKKADRWCAMYINLERRLDRRQRLLRLLERCPELLKRIRRLEAVDGQQLTLRHSAVQGLVAPEALERARHARRRGAFTIVHSGGRLLHFDNHLTMGGIACAMSHKLALEALLQHPSADWGLVLEDDVEALVPDAEQLLQRTLETLPKDWDALFLGAATVIHVVKITFNDIKHKLLINTISSHKGNCKVNELDLSFCDSERIPRRLGSSPPRGL